MTLGRTIAPAPAPSGAGRWAALRYRARAGLLVLGLSGCYVYRPLYTAPQPGMRVVLDINDRGRLELEQRIGPDVASVEGLLRSNVDSLLVVSIVETRGLYGSRTRWSGEPVEFRPYQVRLLRERRYSKPHTFALVTALASSTVAFIATRGLFGLGGGNGPGSGDGDPPSNNQ